MHKFFLTFLFLSITFINLFSQNKQDYYWISNNRTYQDTGSLEYFSYEYVFDFNNLTGKDPVTLSQLCPIMFTGLNASIADEEGNLLFYSNGCQVVDANHQIMPNGTELNNNDYFESLGFSCASGYIGQQDILILPDPVNELGYYIFHKPIIKKKEEVNEKYRELRYSYVDLSLNNGRGEVTEKNIIISGEHELAYSYLTAIPHSNGKDWWIINPTKDSNEYLTILLNKNGVSQVSTQAIGPDFHWNASAGGLAQFSPDGNTYAYF